MDPGDDPLDDSAVQTVVESRQPMSSRFQPKIKRKGTVKLEQSPTPTPSASASPSLASVPGSPPKSEEMKPLDDPPLSHSTISNGVNEVVPEAGSGPMDIDEEDAVVQEIDVFLNPSLDNETQLYNMQYPLRPSWRPYELDERCKEVRMKLSVGHFEIELSLDIDNDENYNKHVDDHLKITKQTLSSSTKTYANEFAVGVLRENKFYVNPLHTIVQFRPSMTHVDGYQMIKQDGLNLERNSRSIEENLEKSLELSNNKRNAMPKDGIIANETIAADEPWITLDYHGSDSPASLIYQGNTLAEEGLYVPFSMKPSDYLYSYGLSTSGYIRKTQGHSKRILLAKPLEERLKLLLSEGSEVNTFDALLNYAPTDPVEDVLSLLQHHAYLVQGLWVTKSSLLYEGLAAIYREYILLQFSKSPKVPDSKVKVVKPEDVRKNLLKPLAVERTFCKDWKFIVKTVSVPFSKRYPEVVEEQKSAWLVREKEIIESLPSVGRIIPSMLKISGNIHTSSKDSSSVGPGNHRGEIETGRATVTTKLTKGQEALAKAILELLQLHKVLSLNSIFEGLQGKANAAIPEVETVANQIADRIHDVYVLKSPGKSALDQFRNVVIEYFIGKGGRKAKVKKQEIKLAAKYRLKRDVSDAEYSQVMNELCVSSGASWMLKSGALK